MVNLEFLKTCDNIFFINNLAKFIKPLSEAEHVHLITIINEINVSLIINIGLGVHMHIALLLLCLHLSDLNVIRFTIVF